MRIVSYNVRYFGHALKGLASTQASARLIAERLCGLDPLPDIICLQEVETISLRSRIARRGAARHETQLESFMAELENAMRRRQLAFPYEAFYFRADSYGLRRAPIYTTGLAIIVNASTLRIDAHNAESPEHITHHHVERWRDRKQIRICAHMHLSDASGRRFHVFNTHLSLPTPFTREFWSSKEKMGFGVNQVREAHKLAQFVRKHAHGEPFIVCGDFNSPPGSPVFQVLTDEAGFVCAQASLGQVDPRAPRRFATAGFMRLRMHLDHVFSSPFIKWLDLKDTCRFDDRQGPFYGLSDHVPLIGCFELAEKQLLVTPPEATGALVNLDPPPNA